MPLPWSLPSLLILLILSTFNAFSPPKGYSLNDPTQNHDEIARKLAGDGQMQAAIASFHAACKLSKESVPCANLGVAYMRTAQYGHAYAAMSEAFRRQPDNQHTKENYEVLLSTTQSKGLGKKELKRLAKQAGLTFKRDSQAPQASASAGSRVTQRSFEWDPHAGASDMRDSRNEARVLSSPVDIADRGRELMQRGEKRLGRGFLSLALHLDPWVGSQLPPWFSKALEHEELRTWQGNLLFGHDKNHIEKFVRSSGDHPPQGETANEIAIYVWRGLELVGLSCCGIDNFVVFLSRSPPWGHQYLVPFVDLTPEISSAMAHGNQQMIANFRTFWQQNGRKPMPKPAIQYSGKQMWDWPRMNVVLPADRVLPGWDELVQGVLAYRRHDIEDAYLCAQQALFANDELLSVVDELMPDLANVVAPRHPAIKLAAAPGNKYLACYSPPVGLGNQAVALVSCHVLAKLTGRIMLYSWNVNRMTRHAYQFKELPDVFDVADAASGAGILHRSHRHIFFYHVMDATALGDVVELLGCSDISKELASYDLVSVSTNMYFAPLIAVNSHISAGTVLDFQESLAALLEPSSKAVKRALAFANKTDWGRAVPVVAVHIRAREKGEDNDDWPTAEKPDDALLANLARCTELAVARDLNGGRGGWDVFVAATTEKARSAVGQVLQKKAKGVRNVLTLPHIERNRKSGAGNIDAMAEALLASRADIFIRIVVGTAGFSTFAFLANALRYQDTWASSMPRPKRGSEQYAPNYVITSECGAGRCFKAPPEVRMSNIRWYGDALQRSCGNPVTRVHPTKYVHGQDSLCEALQALNLEGKSEL